MNKTELEANVCERTTINKDIVSEVVTAVLDSIMETLASGNEVKLTGFASLGVRACAPRKGKNPKTGEALDIPQRNKIYIKAGKKLSALIND